MVAIKISTTTMMIMMLKPREYGKIDLVQDLPVPTGPAQGLTLPDLIDSCVYPSHHLKLKQTSVRLLVIFALKHSLVFM